MFRVPVDTLPIHHPVNSLLAPVPTFSMLPLPNYSDCKSSNLIYWLQCTECHVFYIWRNLLIPLWPQNRHFITTTISNPDLPVAIHSSFSNPSIASPTSQFILQPFFCFSYITSSNSSGEPPMTKAVLISTVRSYGWSFWQILNCQKRPRNNAEHTQNYYTCPETSTEKFWKFYLKT